MKRIILPMLLSTIFIFANSCRLSPDVVCKDGIQQVDDGIFGFIRVINGDANSTASMYFKCECPKN